MPLPVAFALGTWLSGLFVSVVAFITELLGKKLGLAVAVTATMLALTLAFVAALNILQTGLAVSSPGGLFAKGLALMPANTNGCLSAILSAYVLKTAYVWKYRAITRVLEA